MRPVLTLAAPLALLAALAAVLWPPVREAVRRHPYFALREVLVRGPRRVSPDAIRAAAGIRVAMSVWDVDAAAAEARLRGHPWVRAARVRRDLPHRVTIQVREERPVAVIALEGERGGEYYLSARGRLFARVEPGARRDLPYVTGLAAADLSRDTVRPLALRRALALVRRSGGLEVSEVHVDRTRGLTLMPVRPAIPVELGWSGFDEKLARLRRVLALWAGRETEIAAVSLIFDDEVIVRARVAPTRRAG